MGLEGQPVFSGIFEPSLSFQLNKPPGLFLTQPFFGGFDWISGDPRHVLDYGRPKNAAKAAAP